MTDCVSFPLETAADQLGVTRRWLMEWLRKHPWDDYGAPFYRRAGKTKLLIWLMIWNPFATPPVPSSPSTTAATSRNS